jgi:hypothetical protein
VSGVSSLAMVVLVSSVDKVLVELVLEEEEAVVVVEQEARINKKKLFVMEIKKSKN